MMEKLIRKLDLNIVFSEKTVVYGSRRDIVIFTLRLPLVMIFALLAFPIYILWGICLGLKQFWYEFKDKIIDDGIILMPVMGLITAYRLIVYKKVKRGGSA